MQNLTAELWAGEQFVGRSGHRARRIWIHAISSFGVREVIKNIARGTTDPEIESVHLSNLLNNSIYNNKW